MNGNYLVDVLLTAVVITLTMTIERLLPWARLTGREISTVLQYLIWMMGVMLPMVSLLVIWQASGKAISLVAVAILSWILILVGAVVIFVWTWLEKRAEARAQAEVSEKLKPLLEELKKYEREKKL